VETSADDGTTTRILLDLGSGALGSLQRFVDPRTIDAVFLTHLHPDHFLDMCGFYVFRKYHPHGPLSRIPVHGPRETPRRVAGAYGLAEHPGMKREFDFRAVQAGVSVTVGGLVVDFTRVAHPVEAYAIRVGDGSASLVYSGDTGPCDALVELARGTDLLLAESSFLGTDDNPGGLHLTGGQAGEAAAKAGVATLVLTHIPPWHDPQDAYDEARAAYDGRVEVARTGSTYEV
jgi:ribonuclease BN (tRNA processing enzyme)